MSYLDFDNFSCILAQVQSVELIEQFFHNKTPFVLDQVVLDSLLLVPTKFVCQSKELGDGFFDG